MFCYEPQSRPIYEIRIPKENHSKIYSSSYDGTLKCGDMEKAVFTQVRSHGNVSQLEILSCRIFCMLYVLIEVYFF